LKKQQAAASKRYYAKLYKNTEDLDEDTQRVVLEHKLQRAEYQREKYLANREYYLQYSKMYREKKKAEAEAEAEASAIATEPVN
jgi:hypothetical protein